MQKIIIMTSLPVTILWFASSPLYSWVRKISPQQLDPQLYLASHCGRSRSGKPPDWQCASLSRESMTQVLSPAGWNHHCLRWRWCAVDPWWCEESVCKAQRLSWCQYSLQYKQKVVQSRVQWMHVTHQVCLYIVRINATLKTRVCAEHIYTSGTEIRSLAAVLQCGLSARALLASFRNLWPCSNVDNVRRQVTSGFCCAGLTYEANSFFRSVLFEVTRIGFSTLPAFRGPRNSQTSFSFSVCLQTKARGA